MLGLELGGQGYVVRVRVRISVGVGGLWLGG